MVFNAQLGEPFLEMFIFYLGVKFPALEAPEPVLKTRKPALKHPNSALNNQCHAEGGATKGGVSKCEQM